MCFVFFFARRCRSYVACCASLFLSRSRGRFFLKEGRKEERKKGRKEERKEGWKKIRVREFGDSTYKRSLGSSVGAVSHGPKHRQRRTRAQNKSAFTTCQYVEGRLALKTGHLVNMGLYFSPLPLPDKLDGAMIDHRRTKGINI